MLGVYTVTEPENVPELLRFILEEFNRVSVTLTEDEVARARTQLKTTLLAQIDGSTSVCEDIGRQVCLLADCE